MQRNGQNPVKAVKMYEQGAPKVTDEGNVNTKTAKIAGICSACQTEVPLKPGFRVSSLKCPKCGKPLGKK
ncbi:MAG: hypothetical protein PHD29_00225 [bacterium]|nr:hypothetical protein [bacterium]MDD5354816.1 hypothetical protein [bacterium]MDD5756093.1 hypothetical protein [bacterium]